MAFYINTNQQDCSREISVLLKKCILSYPHHWTDLVFLCIGTDRVTGDCLGPYVVIGSVPFVFQEYMFTEHLYSLYMH